MENITVAQVLSALAALGGAQWAVQSVYRAFQKASNLDDRISHLEHRMDKGEKMDELLLRQVKALLPTNSSLVGEIDNFLISNLQDHEEV